MSLKYKKKFLIILLFSSLSTLISTNPCWSLDDNDGVNFRMNARTIKNYRSCEKFEDMKLTSFSLKSDREPLLPALEESSLERNPEFTNVGIEIKSAITPFFQWMENELIQQQRQTKTFKISGYVGLSIGAFAAYSSFPLAADFGELLVDWMGNQNSMGRGFGHYIFGIDAAIPSMALNVVATRQQFQDLLSSNSNLLGLYEDKVFKGFKITAHILGLFSAMSSGYVGYLVSKDFPTPVTILLTSSAYLGCYMFTVESEKRLLRASFNYFRQKKKTQFMRQKLQIGLLKSMKIIPKMEQEEFNLNYEEFFKQCLSQEKDEVYQNNLRKFQVLLKLGEASEELPTPSKWNNYGRIGVEVLGSIIGAAETYVAFKLVEEATLFTFDSTGVENEETRNYVSKLFASLACIPWGTLDIEGVKGRFVRIYNSLFNKELNYQKEFVKPSVKTGISAFSVFGGCSAAIPATYLAIQTTEDFPLGVRISLSAATFLCPATVLTEALEIMLDQFWSWIKSFRKDSLELHKEKLIKVMEKTYLKIGELSDSMIESLYKEVFSESSA